MERLHQNPAPCTLRSRFFVVVVVRKALPTWGGSVFIRMVLFFDIYFSTHPYPHSQYNQCAE